MRSSSVESAIIELLHEEGCHLTAKDILENIRPRLPAVNSSTVYRALERLAAEGIISISDIGQGAAVYEKITEKTHHHLVCQRCGELQTIENDIVNRFLLNVVESSNYHIITNHLVIFGFCSQCQLSTE